MRKINEVKQELIWAEQIHKLTSYNRPVLKP